MATVALQYAGSAVGGMLGGPLGGILGRAAGGLIGSFADARLFGKGRTTKGPRLDDLTVMGSSEGASIPVVWGRARIAGQVIWATDFEEEATRSAGTGAKGTDAGSDAATTYSYYANFAVGLCEGPVSSIGRVWADGKEITLDTLTWRFYRGDEDQMPDGLILAKEGADAAPAYRGLAYIVFERMPLAAYGNRLPQLSFEVTRRTAALETMIRAVDIIPGATEFGYDTEIVTRRIGRAATEAENVHTGAGVADWTVSLDQLQDMAPAIEAAALTVAWFGDDLRCGHCAIKPGVEVRQKSTKPHAWSVAGLDRGEAHLISQGTMGANFGGTPSDASVIRAIRDLKARGLAVMFYPFILMDIPPGNTLPDPVTGAPGQPAFPWRGRISSPPASDVAAGVAAFFGTAASLGLRRMIHHYARLCAEAGGVDAFLLGSEFRGLTRLRDGAGGFPAADALVALAGEVRAILPHAKISYAADWSEYGAYLPDDGAGDIRFPLDRVWASPDIDFVAIDNYFPLADWRDGETHLDRLAGHASPYARAYLDANVEGSEYYDWYYASDADRAAQLRTPIAEWVHRAKDLRGWWSNVHAERIAGAVAPTPWVPQSKPIWFAEAGCPAVDKGANGPNVFVDPKSAESAVPYGSSGARDDFMQRRHLEALLRHWRAASPANPVSTVYGGSMVDPARIFLWAWDARPHPAFPALTSVWSDGDNYETGHWLNGRLGSAPLAELVAGILEQYGFSAFDTDGLEGVIDGYVIDGVMSARAALEPLMRSFAFDAVEQGGTLRFIHRRDATGVVVAPGDLVERAADKPLFSLKRSQAGDLPTAIKLAYRETARDYRTAVVEARRQSASGRVDALIDLPAVLPQSIAQRAADAVLHDAWTSRETATFALPPSFLRLEPGDAVRLLHDGRTSALRIDEIAAGAALAVTASESVAAAPAVSTVARRAPAVAGLPVFGAPRVVLMELPWAASDQPLNLWVAADADPWGSGLAVYRRMGAEYVLAGTIGKPSVMGATLDGLPAGPLWRRDATNELIVVIDRGGLQSVDRESLLAGANLAAVGDEETGFEVIQFEVAELVAPSTYRLSGLLRGQHGSAPEMLNLRPAGTDFVLLDSSLLQLPLRTADAGLAVTWRIGPRGHGPGESTYVETTTTVAAKAARPLAPCHPRARRRPDGDIEIAWTRQARYGGDSWALADVPLDEPAERYALDILSGGVVVRAAAVDAPSYVYARADELADFGALQPAFAVRIAQISSTYGRGASTESLLHV